MIGAILGTIITTLAGSLLWKMALILGAVILIGWLARRIVRGKRDGAPASNEVMALIVMVAIAGAVAGMGYGAADRAAESVAHAKQRAKIEAQLREATAAAEAAKAQLAIERKFAASEAKRAKAAESKIIASQRKRNTELNDLRRRTRDVSKDAGGDICAVPDGWVSAYNAAIGFGGLPATPPNTGRVGGSAHSAQATGTEGGESDATGSQSDAPGLPGRAVSIEDVLVTHIDNADAARDAAERLSALQRWYEALRSERNALRRDDEDESIDEEEDDDF